MSEKELFSICVFNAIAPIHAGSGNSTSVIDLPIQRERHTNWPHIQASGVKGAMREHYRKFRNGNDAIDVNLIFGSDKSDKSGESYNSENDGDKVNSQRNKDIPGTISISDAKLLAFPMRSNVAPFVWVTCPSVLRRLKNDLCFAGFDKTEKMEIADVYDLKESNARVLFGEMSGKVVLEDAVVEVSNDNKESKKITDCYWFKQIFKNSKRLLLISDDMFDYCASFCTEVQTQIKIDSESGTTSTGSLRYQELLPSDTVMYSVFYYTKPYSDSKFTAENMRDQVEQTVKNFIQIGGDRTLGRGICEIGWLKREQGREEANE